MDPIAAKEVLRGLVAYLVPEILRRHDDCLTNARHSATVQGRRPFIVLAKDVEFYGFLCVPLYSHGEVPDLLPVDEKAKGGPPQGWTDTLSFFHPCQFWIVPDVRFRAASFGVEYTVSGKRRSFGNTKLSALRAIIDHRGDSDQTFRHVPISN